MRESDYKSFSLSFSFSLRFSIHATRLEDARAVRARGAEREVASTRRSLTSAAIPSRVTHYYLSPSVRRGDVRARA